MDEWDDELAELPVDRRQVRLRRAAYVTICAALIVLIILTFVFVGDDTTTVAQISADETTSTSVPATTGFATSLPVGVTATSVSEITTTTTTTPRSNTTTSTTTTTTQPPFFYAQAHQADGAYTPLPNSCGQASPPRTGQSYVFTTPQAGALHIAGGVTADGPISPSGTFQATGGAITVTGQLPAAPVSNTQASGQFSIVGINCTDRYNVTWTFSG